MVTILRHGKRPDVRWFVRIDGELTEVMPITKPSVGAVESLVTVMAPAPIGVVRLSARSLIRA